MSTTELGALAAPRYIGSRDEWIARAQGRQFYSGKGGTAEDAERKRRAWLDAQAQRSQESPADGLPYDVPEPTADADAMAAEWLDSHPEPTEGVDSGMAPGVPSTPGTPNPSGEWVYSEMAVTREDVANTPDTPSTPDTQGEPNDSAAFKARLLSHIKSGAWLDAQEFPPLGWIVPGLIAEGCGLLVAPPKIGKSWLALDIGLGVAAGGKVLGKLDVTPRPVLYLALEDGHRRMQSRCRVLLGGGDIPAGFEYAIDFADKVEVMAVLGFWLDAHPDGLVMLDTLGKVMDPARNGQTTYERDYKIVGDVKKATDAHPGSGAIIVHHTRKAGSGDFMDDTSGTNGLNGAADWTINVKRPRANPDGQLLVTGRDVGDGDYAVKFDGGVWTLDGDDLVRAAWQAGAAQASSGLKKDSDRARVVALVAEHPEGLRPRDVAERFGWEGKRATNTLSKLTDAGRIRRMAPGMYGPTTASGVLGVSGVPEDETPSQSELPSTPTGNGLGVPGTGSGVPAAHSDIPPADPCPDCGNSLTGRTGSNSCRWRHTAARKEAEGRAS